MKIFLIQAAAAVVVISTCAFVEGKQHKGDQSMSFFPKKAVKKEEKKMSVGAKCELSRLL